MNWTIAKCSSTTQYPTCEIPTQKPSRYVPPCGFGYTQAETGARLDGQSMQGTAQLLVKHREVMNLPGATEAEAMHDVEEQMCRQLGDEWCVNMASKTWGFPPRLGHHRSTPLKTLFAWAMTAAKGADPYVPQPEAERRAEICRKCFANKRSGECISCGLGDLIRKLIGETCHDRHTSQDAYIDSCLVCGCLLRCKVHIKDEILATGISEKQRTAYAEIPHCWMNGVDNKGD